MKARQICWRYGLLLAQALSLLVACSSSRFPYSVQRTDGDIVVELVTGPNWIHDFPLFGPISKPNRPTFALWISDEAGRYIDTIFVTAKMARGAWSFADDERPEALPLWSSVKGRPVPDALSGATPKGASSYQINPKTLPDRFIVWLEINHSVDYNESYPEGVEDPADPRYSGGRGGSGQPALVYRAQVEPAKQSSSLVELTLFGHSDAGGLGGGALSVDLSGLDSALHILKKAVVHIR